MELEITLFASLVEVLQMKLVSWFNLENKSIFSFSRTKTTKGLSGALLLYSLVLCTVMRVCVCVLSVFAKVLLLFSPSVSWP